MRRRSSRSQRRRRCWPSDQAWRAARQASASSEDIVGRPAHVRGPWRGTPVQPLDSARWTRPPAPIPTPNLAPTPTRTPARWIESDVLDTPHEFDRTADLLYTGRGSLIWLQDLDAWAAVLQRLLSPTGRLVLFEGHPAEWLFDADEDGNWIATDYDYFAGPEASKGWASQYIDRLSVDERDQSWKFARSWTLGEILTAMLGAGLRLEQVAEHPTDWWGGHDDVRPEERGRIPLSFSVV